MKQLKRVLAIIGIVLLLGMYVVTMIFAFMKSDFAQAAFRAALGCTILVPIFLYVFLLIARAIRPEKSKVIDGIIFNEAAVLLNEDGSDAPFRRDLEERLREKGYKTFYFQGGRKDLPEYVKEVVRDAKPEKLLYLDTDPMMVKEMQKLGIPAMRFTDYSGALDKMETLGIRL